MADDGRQWIDIQLHTFANWMNQQLGAEAVRRLPEDLADGVLLIRLVESLQGRRYFGKVYDENPTEIQKLMNVQMALDALREDGVKTVNIGSQDIVEGNTKLILGLMWSIVQRYQIASRTKIPPKKLVMAWMQSVLPSLKLTNFRTNWNDGRALSALLEYCQPGLCPEWSRMDKSKGLENCRRALLLAEQYLGVPRIILPEHLSSPHLDELSTITYLSYFIVRGGPGYRATLQRAQTLLPDVELHDVDESWSDGYLLSLLLMAIGGDPIPVDQMHFETYKDCVQNVAMALEAAVGIGVGSLVGPEDIADPQGEHLGTMALIAALCAVSPSPQATITQCFVNQQVNLDLAFAEGNEVRVEDLNVKVVGPAGRELSSTNLKLRKSRTTAGAVISLVPSDEGFHQVRIFCQGSELPSSPISLHVLTADESRAASRITPSRQVESRQTQESRQERKSPAAVKVERNDSDVDISHKSFAQRRQHIIKQLEAHTQAPPPPSQHSPPKKPADAVLLEASAHREMPLTRTGVADVGLVSFSGLTEPCSIGSIVEVVINAHGDVASGNVYVDAVGPSGKVINCRVDHRRNSYQATFTPDEVGLWKIGILYEGEHIRGSPFSCNVFDAGLVNVYGLDVGLVGQELRFTVDTRKAGAGQAQVSVYHNGHEIPASILAHGEEQRVNFVPDGAGQYKIHVLFNRMEVKGSPFILDIADASSVSVYGDNLRVASVGREAAFQVHAVGADPKDVTVVVTAPSGRVIPTSVYPIEDSAFRVAWTPIEPGEHLVDVRLYDQSVYDSPFTCNVGAPERVAVRGMPRRLHATRDLNTDQSFEIDASSAGSGNLEIMVNGGRVECRVKEIGSRQYLAIFTPTQAITHTVEMRFNGQEVPGSPWKIPVEEKPSERRADMAKTQSFYSELCGAGLVRAPVNRTANFEISGDGLELPDIKANIYGPDGKEYPVRIIPRGSGKYTAEYKIDRVGEYQLTVWISGRKVDGSPLPVAGYSPNNVKIEPLGGGAVGSPVQFIVDAVDAGKGQLEISVNQGRVPNNVQMQGAGRCLVTFIPQHPGTYVIDVAFNGEPVHGCPIKVDILPKQVGQTVQANLTPTAVSTAINAGGTASISSAFRQSRSPTSPTSPTLLRHARQRSEEAINPRSPNLLRDARGRQEQPWKSSYAPSSSRVSSSVSPSRQWTASSVYDRIYGSPSERDRATERTLSPSDPTRSHVFSETSTTTTTAYRRTPSPITGGVRSREFAERQETDRTVSPGQYERRYESPFGKTRDIPIRSPSPPRPTSRDQASPYGRTPSPGPGERIRQVERIDPLAEEEARERRRQQMEREKGPTGVGYTVAQYGEPGDRATPIRHFGDTLERTRTPEILERNRTPTTTERVILEKEKVMEKVLEPTPRASSPGYATVYERYEKTTEWKEDGKAPVIAPYRREAEKPAATPPPPPVSSPPEREPSPVRDYGSERGVTSVLRKYETGGIVDVADGRPRHEYENVDRKPEVPRRAATPEGRVDDYRPAANHKENNFTRTQSEVMPQQGDVIPPIHRTEEKESIYDMPPKADIITPSEDERREAEIARIKAEDDQILQKLGFQRKVIHDKSIEIEEPMADISDNVVEPAGSREHLADRPTHPLQSLEPVAELPHSPAPSTKSTPATTPRTSAKFNKEGKDQKKKFDFGKSKFSSKHEVIKRGKEVEVKLDSLKLGKEDVLRVVVMAPIRAQNGEESKEVETKVKKSGSKYEISFKPTEVGTHKIFAYVNDHQHPSSPFAIRVYDSSQIVVGDIPKESHLNDTVEFTVDAGRAGFGNLEMAIKDSDGVIIPSHVAQLETGSAKFLVTFTPAAKGPHTVNITFNKEVLKNSPFEVLITDPIAPPKVDAASPPLSKKEMKKEEEKKKKEEKERAKREKEEKIATLKREKKSKHKHITKTEISKIPSLLRVGQPNSLIVDVAGGDQLLVTVNDNQKNQLGTEITEIEPGVMQIEFTPTQVGDHEIDVRYAGVPINSSPFTCRAYDPAMIRVGTIPKGLLDKEVVFTVDASEAGVGNLEVAVNDGRVPSQARALGGHKYDISFVPKEDVDHTISVRFNNEPVPGSPFICQLVNTAKAHASGPGLERIPVDEEAEIFVQAADDASPVVRVRDSQAIDLPVKTNRRDPSTLVASFVPKCVGNHQVDISVLGEPIPGSPFTAKAYDSRQARLTPCEPAVVGQATTFVIDAARAGAGNMEIIVSVDGRNVPNFVQAEGQAKFKVSFTPQEARDHVVSVKFNGQSVPGSPMICKVDSAAPIATIAPVVSTGLTGAAPMTDKREKTGLAKELAGMQIGQKKGFTIPNPGRSKDCNVVITAPNGAHLPVDIERRGDDLYAAFTPLEKGTHEMDIFLDGQKYNEMPILFFVRHALPPVCLVGKKYRFDVDAETKDDVRVEVVDPQGKPLPVQLENLVNNGGVGVSCRFKQIGQHTIDVFVKDQKVGETATQKVADPLHAVQLVSEVGREIVGQSTELKLLIEPGLENEVEVEIEGPDRNSYETTLKKFSDTLWSVHWTPKIEGKHEMSLLVGGEYVTGSPFTIPVLDPSAVRVIGLRNDRVGTEIQFNVDYASSGASTASVDITCGKRVVPCTVKKVKPGLLVCSFTPTMAGSHAVDVSIDGLLLPECPYDCFVTDSGGVRAIGDALKKAQRGRTARFEVALNERQRGELDVMVTDPKGGPLPVKCYKQADDSYWVEFSPEMTGTHTIEITFDNVQVSGSPFRCEVVDPRKVAVRGIDESLILRHATTMTVQRGEAGTGDLQVEITDPSGSPLRVEMLKSPGGDDRFTFLPNKTGPHKVNVKMAGFQLPGYPQIVMVGEVELPAVYGAAMDQSVKLNEPASIIFDPKKQNGGLKVSVTGPSEHKLRHNVMRRPNGTSEVVFYPEEVGLHRVAVDFNNKPLKGSPFSVRVVDPSKVLVNDLDMDRDGSFLLRLGQDNVFDVDATAAGPGKLRAEVRDAEGTLLGDGPVVHDLGYGKYRVSFQPPKPDRYSIYLYWNELPVESAFPVRARFSKEEPPMASTSRQQYHEYQRTPEQERRTTTSTATHIMHAREKSGSSAQEDDIARVIVRGDALHRAMLKEANEFIVDGSDMSREGRLTATLLGQKVDIPVRLQQVGHNVFKANYTPLTGGTYELHVLWNGKHVNGSPFKVIADSSTLPADLITVDGSTLKIGIVNEEMKTLIDTRRAGPGQLSANCMGPVKPAYCELYDHRDGTYTLNIRPSEIGKHTLTVKYNDAHVRGSPFLIHVSLPPDPSKVRVYGPGIEHGILSLFKSNFVVETRGAGAGQLTVRVRGPKGAFNVEMQREKKNERTIHCKYEPKEPGDYQVEVKWHGEHVPGSPFFVMIVDTEQELARFLRGEMPSPSPATPFVPPGWVGPPPPMFHPHMGPPPPRGYMGPPMGPPMGPQGPMVPYGAPTPPRHKGKYH